jgi:choline-glycine betaine transporter
MKPLILVACFLPLAMIWIIMKLSLWIAAVNEEQTYVREESLKPHGPYVANAYEDVDEEEEENGDRTDYR